MTITPVTSPHRASGVIFSPNKLRLIKLACNFVSFQSAKINGRLDSILIEELSTNPVGKKLIY